MNNKISILIADDEEHFRKLINILVADIGCNVIAKAKNGGETIAMYKQTQPDIVLLDINMPQMNGIEVLQRIMEINPAAYVVMLTAKNTLSTVHNCIKQGAKHYILKDNSIERLRLLLIEIIQNFTAQESSTGSMLP